ncbi:MAG TPA: acetate--CoA ligase family protein [Candidatus Acidoferrum sp.]|nr:acetate--CoA ligase family protein [Candidatus Acidoferrum sp.]
MNLTKLLKPQSIAIIGASEKPGFGAGTCKIIMEYRKDLSRVYFVSPTRPEVFGKKCYKSIGEIDDVIDLAVICTPQPTVIGLLREAHAKGCGGAVVYASGYSEVGTPEGVALEEELQAVARELDMAVMGPNCGGFMNYVDDSYAFAFPGDYANKLGGIGFVSQSGQFCIDMMNAPELRFSYSISAGNSRIVQVEDYMNFFVQDPDTKVIALYLEGLKDPAKFEQSLKAAAEAKKPVIVLKMGRSPKGEKAAASHTGSMSGADRMYDAVFKKYGVIRVEDMQDMRSTASLFGTLKKLPKKAAFSNANQSGGTTGLCADLGYLYDINFPDFSKETLAKLEKLLPSFATPGNPLDMTAATGFASPEFIEAVSTAFSDENIEAGLVGWLIGEKPVPERVEGMIEVSRRIGGKPLMVVTTMERNRNPETVAALQKAGIAVLPTMVYGFKALRHLSDFIEYNALDHTLALAVPDRKPAGTRKALSEYASKKMLKDSGVPLELGEVVSSPKEAVEAAKRLGFPAVLKIESDDILHKSDVGGVKLNLKTDADIEKAYADIMRSVAEKAPKAKINGILVQHMLPAGVEMILGINSDPQFGPMLLVGLGGVFVEVFKDAALYPCPVGKKEARAMLESLKAYKLLTGYRGGEPADVEALIDTMVAVSDFAVKNKNRLKELDVNPLFVYPKGKGVAVADALVVLED